MSFFYPEENLYFLFFTLGSYLDSLKIIFIIIIKNGYFTKLRNLYVSLACKQLSRLLNYTHNAMIVLFIT